MPPRFREHTGAGQNARHSTERWVHPIQPGTRQNPGLRAIFIARNSGDFYLSPCHPEGCCKIFLQQPYFYALQVVLGMQISFFRSPNAPSSWMERFILRGIPRLFVTFPRNFSFFPECLLTNHLLGRILQQTIFSPAPGKKLAVGNVLTFLSPYSNIPYGKKAGRYQGLEFCRRIITRVTEESMWQR